ncbi:hypothetical protein MKW94_000449 [Papaver nudicaule]|uniref:Uncharacterized protein n=1 Tax=Papaver nudicaule TaxID=74823 RepID=A0AA42AWC7_PAPNU|nr:hypothetical protein [Papaver nudicaule]
MDKRSKPHPANRSGGERKILHPVNRFHSGDIGKRPIPRVFAEAFACSQREANSNFAGQSSSDDDKKYLRSGVLLSVYSRNPENEHRYIRNNFKSTMKELAEAREKEEDFLIMCKESRLLDDELEAQCKVSEEVSEEE